MISMNLKKKVLVCIFVTWQIRIIERNCEIPHEGPFCDLMWSDPEDIETWAVSPRGAGWLFGSRVTSEVIYTYYCFILFHMLLNHCFLFVVQSHQQT